MKRGDVVLCRFPHASPTASKVRPALVVQSDYYNTRISNVLVAGITGNLTNAGDAAHFLIDLSTAAGQQSGLQHNSLVSCINVAVVPPRFVQNRIGELPDEAMRMVDDCLRVALGL